MNHPEPEANTETALDHTAEKKLTQSNNIENNGDHSTVFFPVSEGKLITMYIFSFGIYGVYWFYKNWKLQQVTMDKKIYPVWRAIFSIFFTHSLFRRIDQQASHLEQKHRFNANILATFFVTAIIVSNIIDHLSISSHTQDGISNNTVTIISLFIFFLSTYPLVRVQSTVNRINNDMLGFLNHKYSPWNYVLIAFGVIFWLLIALGLLLDSMGFVVTE